MRTQIALLAVLSFGAAAENLEKAQKKDLEVQVKAFTREAAAMEKAGQLAEARIRYAESQALIEVKEVTEAIKRLDEQIQKNVRDVFRDSRKLYEQRDFAAAAALLEGGMKLQVMQAALSYNLALCYYQLGERAKGLDWLSKAKSGTADPKQKEKVAQLLTFLTTAEKGPSMSEAERVRLARVNRLVDSIGMEASLEDSGGGEEGDVEAAPPLKTERPASPHTGTGHKSSLCDALGEVKSTASASAAGAFNLANCAETNGRAAEAAALLEKYLLMAPAALDAAEARRRILELKSLLSLPDANGVEVRKLYASAHGALEERRYDAALTSLQKADALAPEFALTKWKLALLYEALGDTERARANFTRYRELATNPAAQDEADLHLASLEVKRAKYDDEVGEAEDILGDLFNRAMKLTFNGSGKRSALRTKRAQVKNKDERKIAQYRVGGFAIPFPYAQQQLARASEHLQIALALFPLGAEANELMALVLLQANDGRSATKSFDAVVSQGLPAVFYAELRTRKMDRPVKCELSRDGVRLIFLASYDKKGNATAPRKTAGEDGLGDLVMTTAAARGPAESLDVKLADIKRVETDKGVIKLKLAQQEVWLSPIYMPSFTPIVGPQARRFANNYTRLFVRYPGLENSKLGNEGMTGGEKFKMAYKLANAGMDIATGGFGIIGAISSVQDAITIARTIRGAVDSLKINFAAWERTVEDRQQLLAGKAFKWVPTEAVSLGFVEKSH